jgi:hypothetical protein
VIAAQAPAALLLGGLRRPALVVGLLGLVASAIGWLLSPARLWPAYLVAYLFWLGLALGCLGIALLQTLTGGVWGLVTRRVLEAAAGTLPLLALLFVPLAFGLPTLYLWARPEAVAADPLLVRKGSYLNVPFFLARAAVYLLGWAALAALLGRWSGEQDRSGAPEQARKLRRLGAGGLPLLGLTVSFAAIDWLMSLEPDWYSTVYGGMVALGALLSAFAFTILVVAALAKRPPLAGLASPSLFNDLGNLLLAFLMLWTYLAYSQFLLIWAGNLHEETPWYLRRLEGGWLWVALALALLGFALPFLLLVFRPLKRSPRLLAGVAGLLLVMRYVDLYWLVKPVFTPPGPRPDWLDLATLLGIGGLWLAAFLRQLSAHPLLPAYDPRLPGPYREGRQGQARPRHHAVIFRPAKDDSGQVQAVRWRLTRWYLT